MADPTIPERAHRDGDQALPKPGEGDIILTLAMNVPAELLARRRTGIKRYGTPLQAHNGRNACRDLREELLDALAYSEQEAVERAKLEEDLAQARADLASHVEALDRRIETLRAERDAARENFLAARDARDAALLKVDRLTRELALEVEARKHLEERLGG